MTPGPTTRERGMGRPARLRLTAVMCLAVSALIIVPAANAAVPLGVLLGVSCTGANACVAVGTDSSDPNGGRTLAEAWNGMSWTVMLTPNPPSIGGSNLYGVSCISAHACMAVGQTSIVHGGKPLAERWDGTAWKVVATPRPRGGDSGLNKVSCGAVNACVAVGFAIRSSHNNAFAETWNGAKWTLRPIARRVGTTFSALDDVSCGSARACVAVGDSEAHNSSKDRTLAERWDGRRWRINSTPNPRTGINGAGLTGVSCRTARACMAVGSYAKPSNNGALTLAEQFNGKSWSISKSKSAATTSILSAVSCGSAKACMAVGANDTSALAEIWNGTTWALTPIPAPAHTSLEGTSCGAPNTCVAVGWSSTDPRSPQAPVAEVWNDALWRTTPAP